MRELYNAWEKKEKNDDDEEIEKRYHASFYIQRTVSYIIASVAVRFQFDKKYSPFIYYTLIFNTEQFYRELKSG